MLEALGFFAADGSGRARRRAARRARARPAARRGPGLRQGARRAAGRLAGLDGRQHRARGLRPGDDRRRVRRSSPCSARSPRGGCAGSARGCATGAEEPRAGGSRAGAAAGSPRRRCPAEDPVRRRLWLGSEAVFAVAFAAMALLIALRARRLEHREADGRDADDRDPGVGQLPAAGRRGWRGRRSTTTTSATCCWRCPPHALSLEPSVGLQPRGRRAVRALGVGGLHARGDAVGGGAGARRARRRRAGRRRAGGRRARASCSATSRARASGCARTSPPGDYDWFAVSRVIPDTINEFPAFSFTLGDLHAHVLAIPFTLLALAFALQVALDGPRGDLALARGGRGADRRARGRRAVRDQLVVVSGRGGPAGRRRRGLDAQPGGARAAAVRRGLDGARAARRASCSCCRSGWTSTRRRAGSAGSTSAARSARWAGDMALIYGVLGWAVLAAYAGRLLAARQRVRIAVWGARRRRVRALAAGAGRPRRRRAAARRARASRCTPRSRAGSRRPSASCGCSSRAASRACSRPSSSTCATSSTTASCTG